ncbi:PIN domain-containing protein [Roseateles noduli]|uniref:PIN domain-containing protein n=1 Tax=Roseateles noduli TaxID=2052484 RepID=UPI003D65B188
MGAVDTNVLIRCIVRDDPRQFDAVARLRECYVREGSKLFVPVTVLLEFEWVLRSRFGFGKAEVIGAMSKVLNARDLLVDREMAMGDALAVFKLCDADLADCMHARISAWEGQGPLHTFDRCASTLPGAQLLSTKVEEPRPAWRTSRTQMEAMA